MRPRQQRMSMLIPLLCAACAPLPEVQPAPAATSQQQPAEPDAGLSPARLGTLLNQVDSLDATAAQTEIVRLQRDTARRDATEQLRLACLLSRREDRTPENLRQADTLLENLISGLRDSETRALARLLQRNIRLQLSLAAAHSQVAEYTRKIQQIKGLEQELQQHNLTTDPASDSPSTPRK